MPDEFDNDDESPEDNTVIKDLRAKARERDQLAEQAAEQGKIIADMQRREAFRDAGLDPKNDLHAAVMAGYSGEMDTDKVQEWVATLGLNQPAASAPQTQVPATEMQQIQQAASMMAGGDVPPPPPPLDAQYEAVFNSLPEMNRLQHWGAWLAANGQDVSYDGPQGPIAPWGGTIISPPTN